MNCRNSRGFTLVELMVSMVLGLVVVGGVISVLVANRSSYRTNEGLSQVQESARTAFELLARDLRQTGSTGCDNARRMANVVNATPAWWRNWVSVQGFDGVDAAVATGTAVGTRVAGTDTLHLHSIEGGGFPVNVHSTGAATMSLSVLVPPAIAAGDIMMVCDFDHAAIFQASAFDTATSTISYTTAGTPGNCSTGLGFPTDCSSAVGNVYPFPRNSWVGRLQAVTWYIGNNGRVDDGGSSLYRVRLDSGGALVTEEIVSGVSDMQIEYSRNASDLVTDATTVTADAAWPQVNAVFVTVTVNSTDQRISSNNAVASGRLTRTFTYLVALRNRVP
jgi:type IV pilus assembly protein PilW